MVSLTLKHTVLIVVLFAFLCKSPGKCQDDDEEEDEYDEETADLDHTTAAAVSTTRKYRVRASTTLVPPPSGRNESDVENTSEKAVSSSAGAAVTPASAPAAAAAVPAAASPPLPPTRAPAAAAPRATTPSDDSQEEEEEDSGIGFVFRPLSSLIDNIVAGNVSGIVDNALSIRTPPEVRVFVNNIMSNVFGSRFGGALKQFVPRIFSTTPATTGRDAIPASAPQTSAVLTTVQIPAQHSIPLESNIIEAKATAEDGNIKTIKNGRPAPIHLKFAHPGAPASRLKCEVVME